jgi:hypothetical protein
MQRFAAVIPFILLISWGAAGASCIDAQTECDACDPSYYHYVYYGSYWDSLPLETVSPFWTITDGPTTVAVSGRGFEPASQVRLDSGGAHELGRAEDWGMFLDVALLGDHALVVRGDPHCYGSRFGCRCLWTQSLWSWDLTDPSSPEQLAEVSFDGWAPEQWRTVEASGNLALVSTGSLLEILDMQDPTAPRRIGGLDLASAISHMATTPGMAYLATNSTVSIVRTEPAERPELVSVVDWSGNVTGVEAAGTRVYLTGRSAPHEAEAEDRLLVIDASDPDAPLITGELVLPRWSARDIAARGEFVYLVGNAGLQVVQVGASGMPVLSAVVETGATPTGVRLEGNHAYVSLQWPSGVQIYDVRDPHAPVFVGRETARYGESFRSESLEVVGDRLLLASNHETRAYEGCPSFTAELQLFDVEHPRSPTLVAGLAVAGSLRRTVVLDGYAYAMGDNGSLFSIDIHDASRPELVDRLPGLVQHDSEMAASDGLVFAAFNTVRVLDVSDPAAPVLASSFYPGFAARAVAASGRRLFLSGWGPLQVYDVQDAASPLLIGSYPLQGTVSQPSWAKPPDVAALGDTVFVVESLDSRSHLLVLDVSTPGDPVFRGEAWIDPWGPGRIAVLDRNHVVVATSRLSVVNVSDPEHPGIIASLDLDLYASDLVVAGTTAYVAGSLGEIQAFDLRDPSGPRPAGAVYHAIDRSGDYGIAASGEHLIVAADMLLVVRSNPPLNDVRVTSGSNVEFTVPAGFAPGAYDVRVANTSCPRSGRLENGIVVCARRDLSARLEPFVASSKEPGSTSWALRVDGDEGFFLPQPSHEAILLLPDVPEHIETRYLQGNGAGNVSLELHPEQGVLWLVAATVEEAEAIWSQVRDAGGFVLPRRDAHTYGPVGLQVVSRSTSPSVLSWSNDTIPLDLVGSAAPDGPVFRYELLGGSLDRALAVGTGVDLSIEVTARDESRCETGATVEVR